MIKNLNQLKRRLRPGTRLEVTGHCRPGCIGQLREVTWVNTQGVYTKILNPPDPRINAANDGRGSIMWWGAASTWSFEDGVCSSYMNQTKTAETLIMLLHGLIHYLPRLTESKHALSRLIHIHSVIFVKIRIHKARTHGLNPDSRAHELHVKPFSQCDDEHCEQVNLEDAFIGLTGKY